MRTYLQKTNSVLAAIDWDAVPIRTKQQVAQKVEKLKPAAAVDTTPTTLPPLQTKSDSLAKPLKVKILPKNESAPEHLKRKDNATAPSMRVDDVVEEDLTDDELEQYRTPLYTMQNKDRICAECGDHFIQNSKWPNRLLCRNCFHNTDGIDGSMLEEKPVTL